MTEGERAIFAGLADVLVPDADGMPAASTAGVHERWLDRVLAARPDLVEPLRALLAEARLDPVDEIERLRSDEPERFALLLSIVTSAYYLSPRVRRLVGYPGQRATEVFPDHAEYDLRDGLIDPVVARGPIWRRPP